MVIKKPVITVYENDPISVEKELVDKRFSSNVTDDSPRLTLTQNDSIESVETNFKDFVEKFNRVMLNPTANSLDLNYSFYAEKGYNLHLSDQIFDGKSSEERLKELEEELGQLEDDVRNNPDSEVTEDHLNTLKTLVESAKIKLETHLVSSSSQSDAKPAIKDPKIEKADLALLSERIDKILSRIGADPNTSSPFLRPLTLVIEELLLRVGSLTSQNKAEINTELSATISQLQDFQKSSQNESYQKINQLYDTLQKWNTECQVLPQLLQHLRRCANLSEHSNDVIKNIEGLESGLEESKKLLESLCSSDTFQNTVVELEKIQQML
ncbi:unnamed protein product [Bursaphelenchus xylophilus]|uniref:(pine wood nematode) hypothetical protein n=1 Tax=Bursaphelenchus xylophilus TaxID=6326 RepID=A0A1I7RHC5_BURXY|nr:unnamed protein product [Bursaphelenchus xylophilus]CAG9115850.1 unnamed protein product [Bursaphelenchus xylophilus]